MLLTLYQQQHFEYLHILLSFYLCLDHLQENIECLFSSNLHRVYVLFHFCQALANLNALINGCTYEETKISTFTELLKPQKQDFILNFWSSKMLS